MAELVLLNTIGYCGAALLLGLVTYRAATSNTFAHLFSLVWGSCLLAAQFFTTSTQTLSSKTLIILFAAWWALLAGGLLTIRRQPASAPPETPINKRRALALVLILIGLHAALSLYELPAIIAGQSTAKVVIGLRTTLASRNLDKCPWWLEIFRNAYFVYLPLALLLRKRGWLSRRAFYILVVASCLLALTRMTRAPLLANILTLWASWALFYRPRALRAWGILAVGLLSFSAGFVAIQLALTSHNTHTAEGVQLVEGYYGGSMRAFESIVDGTFPREAGYYSADMFNYALYKLKLIDSYPSLIRPYGNYATNIYTFLDAYALDGGLFGALFGATLTGVAGGWLFTRASRHQSPLIAAAYSLFAYCIAMAVANNEFIRINPLLTTVLAGVVGRIVVRGRASRSVADVIPTARDLGRRQPGALIART